MKATYVDHMGSDLTVVNAARVSFAKESSWEIRLDDNFLDGFESVLNKDDAKLIKYLARHNHWTPFGHPQITIHVKAPIFVARQLGKHQVGMVWNEVSRRYVDDMPEFYVPSVWRKRAKNIKQGSSHEEVKGIIYEDEVGSWEKPIKEEYSSMLYYVKQLYKDLLAAEVSPEQARMVLPQSMYTEWYWTGSLAAWSRVCKLRLDPNTQKETREIAQEISDIIKPLFPISWSALID